jgi:hypothetical protein
MLPSQQRKTIKSRRNPGGFNWQAMGQDSRGKRTEIQQFDLTAKGKPTNLNVFQPYSY